jgi:Flp pilus assembly protein TadD
MSRLRLIISFCALPFLAACVTADGERALTADPVMTQALPDGGSPVAPQARAAVDPAGDAALGKQHFRAKHYGLSELHFRRAVEASPTNAEAWLGLAASYDQLRRFDQADKAYAKAIALAGPTVEILNNRGFSYMLRGDLPRASKDLAAAMAKSPDNPQVLGNMKLLEEKARSKI